MSGGQRPLERCHWLAGDLKHPCLYNPTALSPARCRNVGNCELRMCLTGHRRVRGLKFFREGELPHLTFLSVLPSRSPRCPQSQGLGWNEFWDSGPALGQNRILASASLPLRTPLAPFEVQQPDPLGPRLWAPTAGPAVWSPQAQGSLE